MDILASAHKSLIRPISSYFKNGLGGNAFVNGLLELAKHFEWDTEGEVDSPSKTPITHAEFCCILSKMCDVIDSSDNLTEEDIEHAQTWLQKKKELEVNHSKDVLDPGPELDVEMSQQEGSGNKHCSPSQQSNSKQSQMAGTPGA